LPEVPSAGSLQRVWAQSSLLFLLPLPLRLALFLPVFRRVSQQPPPEQAQVLLVSGQALREQELLQELQRLSRPVQRVELGLQEQVPLRPAFPLQGLGQPLPARESLVPGSVVEPLRRVSRPQVLVSLEPLPVFRPQGQQQEQMSREPGQRESEPPRPVFLTPAPE
jgi:hypothetical protein